MQAALSGMPHALVPEISVKHTSRPRNLCRRSLSVWRDISIFFAPSPVVLCQEPLGVLAFDVTCIAEDATVPVALARREKCWK